MGSQAISSAASSVTSSELFQVKIRAWPAVIITIVQRHNHDECSTRALPNPGESNFPCPAR